MKSNLNINRSVQYKKKFYIPVQVKFIISHIFSILWTGLSIYLSLNWLRDFSKIVTLPVAIIVITGIAYVPGYLNTFLVISLILDRQPPLKNENPDKEVTILIAARNEEDKIENTLSYIAKQDYKGKCNVFVIDNGSTDATASTAINAAKKFNLDVTVLREENPGKYNALNTGLKYTATDYVITLDADTLLHKSAVRYLVARIESAPDTVCAVAGSILVRNSRDNLLTKIQEWDYFLGIASIKRLQGLYQGTLVAQGAYSLYKTKNVIEVGGWPNAIGEDIVLTWNLLEKGWSTYFEPMAVAFTDVPVNLRAFARQRSRWARGMIEALKQIKPWKSAWDLYKIFNRSKFTYAIP
jgi:biofilm PGA synthesis N-glycosyltransferase PgaC